jgi:hypothetical protein
MKKCLLLFMVCFYTAAFAQKETFDIITYSPPSGWTKDAKTSVISYTIIDKQKGTWCQIGVYSSTASKGSIDQDFDSEWQELVAKQYKTTDPPQVTDIPETDGWKTKAGGCKFSFNNSDALATLTTFSGYGKAVSIVASTNTTDYIPSVQNLIASIELTKPDTTLIAANTIPVNNTANSTGFSFSTTNWDDGWTSVEKADWVEVTKGNIRILLHYKHAQADAYNSDLMVAEKNAWNILVAPRYSSAANLNFKPHNSWQSIEFADADLTESATGKQVYVVFFKKHYSNGSGTHVEFICPDRQTFENEFGRYNAEESWDKVEKMLGYNKFAVAASDLSGTWTSNFSGMTQYVNAYTGASAGADTHASSQKFVFGEGNSYNWDIGMASGFVGSIKFQTAKGSGKFTLLSPWQVQFSEMEGKPKTFDAYFSCSKGARVLWLSDVTYPGYTAFGKAN